MSAARPTKIQPAAGKKSAAKRKPMDNAKGKPKANAKPQKAKKRLGTTKKPALIRTGANGRPSAFRPEYAEEAFELYLAGFTDEKMAAHFEVSVNTIGNWRKIHPEFLGAVRRGKALADGKVARGLYERAIGFEVKKDVVIGKGEDARIETLFEKLPPDTQAAKFWLKNRVPEFWKENQLVDDQGVGLFSIVIHERERTPAEKAALLAQRQAEHG